MKEEPENPRTATKGEVADSGNVSFPEDPSPRPGCSKDRYRLYSEVRKTKSLLANLHICQEYDKNKKEEQSSRAARRKLMSELGFGRRETYLKLNQLGKGTYGTVFRGRSSLTNSIVAMKEIRIHHDEGMSCTALREVSLLKQLKHINIVTLHDVIYSETCLTLVLEFMETDLTEYMAEYCNILRMRNVKLFLFQLLRGLSYCHQQKILHRDLKPQNLLINKKGVLKIADFGLARAQTIPSKTYTKEVVTLKYRSPDVLMGSTKYSTDIDMWSVGCIFFEMASGSKLFPGTNVQEQLTLIEQLLGPLDTHMVQIGGGDRKIGHAPGVIEALEVRAPRLHRNGIALLSSFLQYEPRERISAAEAMRHPYFNSLGPKVHELDERTSIYSIPAIKFMPDIQRDLENSDDMCQDAAEEAVPGTPILKLCGLL